MIAGRLRAAMERMRGRPKLAPAILMYHRVARLDHDPWGLAVSPERFATQMDYLARHRTPLALDVFVAALDRNALPADAVAITFDDGYVDNSRNALPALEASAVPATLFVVTGHIGGARSFWWDELTHLVLGHDGAIETNIRIGDTQIALSWTADRTEAPDWRAWNPPADGRETAYAQVWRALQRLPGDERRARMDELAALLGPVTGEDDRAMTAEELAAFAASEIIDIGAHSVTHAALTALSEGELDREIAGSRAACEAILGRPVAGFAYPYGDMSRSVRAAVVRRGFAWACSTEEAAIHSSKVDRFALPRLGVGDWDVDRLAEALQTL